MAYDVTSSSGAPQTRAQTVSDAAHWVIHSELQMPCWILIGQFDFCAPAVFKLSILGDIWRAIILFFSPSKYFYSCLRLKFIWSFI